MIEVTRFDDSVVSLNPHRIISVESTPDTIITLSTGSKIMVKEGLAEIKEKFIRYQMLIRSSPEKYVVQEDESGT